jgi:hypothetical protein
MDWWKKNIGKLVDFYVRPRSVGLLIFRSSASVWLLLAGGGGISWIFRYQSSDSEYSISWGGGVGVYAFWALFVAAGLTAIVGLVMAKRQADHELTEKQVSRTLVVELRGLVDTSDSPLIKAVPSKILGRRESCLVDIRRLVAGSASNIPEALQELSLLQRQIRLALAGTSREHITVVAGGVMQVSLLFYAGVLLDDEGRVVLFEWERVSGNWQELNHPDSGMRFAITGLDEVNVQSPDVVVAISASYQVDSAGIEQTFPNIPVVHLRLSDPKPNSLMSELTQGELTRQFTNLMAELANRSVGTAHLILAAPATLCLRLGQAYDRRNMPNVNCYQREREQTPPYPWYVRMDSTNPAHFERTLAPVIHS